VLEFVSDGVNGFVARPEPESIGAAIERLWQDKGLCRRFGEGGRERVKDISWDNVVSALTQTL
jgi:glycosyltransferase involved in cell wall biosynthesis